MKGGITVEIKFMREHVAKAYSSRNWKAKVSKMSDSQIIAIYTSFVKRKKNF
jgi:hypothetical protein